MCPFQMCPHRLQHKTMCSGRKANVRSTEIQTEKSDQNRNHHSHFQEGHDIDANSDAVIRNTRKRLKQETVSTSR